jgi:cytolysin-activating lysine-acyltransferase
MHQQPDNKGLVELAKQQAEKVMSKIPLLGAVSWLMMQQTATRHTLLSELEWRVMPPLMLDQAKLYMKEKAPLAYVSWAYLSEDAAKRYRQTPHHLMPSDWKSGDQVWMIDLCTPFGGSQELMNDLREGVLSGQEVHQLMLGADGKIDVMTWSAVTPK